MIAAICRVLVSIDRAIWHSKTANSFCTLILSFAVAALAIDVFAHLNR